MLVWLFGYLLFVGSVCWYFMKWRFSEKFEVLNCFYCFKNISYFNLMDIYIVLFLYVMYIFLKYYAFVVI